MMVCWHHSLNQLSGVSDFITLPEFGPKGVDLFFVISGFIMALTTAAKPISAGRFFAFRIVRVVPLYWLATLLMVACAVALPQLFKSLHFDAVTLTKSLLFIPHYSLSWPDYVYPVLVPGWTLNFEMFFYALFAASLLLPRARAAALATALCLLVGIGLFFGPFTNPFALTYTDPRLLEFAIGMGIAWSYMHKHARAGLVASLFAIAAGFFLLSRPDSTISVIAGATIIVYGSLHPRILAWQNRPLLELGNASYSIYLSHLFALGALRVVWVRLVPTLALGSAWAFMMVGLAVCAAAGWLCYRFIEKPMTKRLHNAVK